MLMISREIRLMARDGLPLAATLYEPTAKTGLKAPLCLVIIAGEAGLKRPYYEPFAEHLASRGCAVLTFDYRGIGGSLTGEVREAQVTASQWGKLDLCGALDWAQQYISLLPVFVIAHGIGGQLVGLVDEPDRANEYLFIAAGLDHWKHWPKSERMRRTWRYTGKVPMMVRAFNHLPRGVLGYQEDIPGAAALRIARWARNAHGAAGVEQTPGFVDLSVQITAYSFTDDEWTSPLAAEGLLACYPNARTVHIPMTPFKAGTDEIGHLGFFHEDMEDQLWPRATEWLRREIPLVMRQREEAEAEERKAKGLPPKPSKQAVAKAQKLRAIAGTETAKRAEAEAAAKAELEAAQAAEQADSRRMSRRRALRSRNAVDETVGGVEQSNAIEQRRAQRLARRRRDDAVAEPDRTSVRSAAEEVSEQLRKTPLSAITSALGKRDPAAIKDEPQPDTPKAKEKANADSTAPLDDGHPNRQQAAALSRMAKVASNVSTPLPPSGPGGEGGDKGNLQQGDFRRVPSRRRRGLTDTQVPEPDDDDDNTSQQI